MLNAQKISIVLDGLKPAILMVIVQIISAVLNILYKLAIVDQFSPKVLVAYRFLFTTAFMVPIALYVERNKRPKFTWMILLQVFLSGLFGGVMAQNLYAGCLALTSATFAAAIVNLIPSVTFVMALIFGMEKLGWRTMAGEAKVLGTLTGIGGAMLLTFYKGPEINIWKSHIDLLKLVQHRSQHLDITHQHSGNLALGAIFGVCFAVCCGFWFIIQAKMVEKYPCPYSITALMSTMGCLQGAVYALCTEKDRSQWTLGWNIRLLTVAYSGLASGVMFSLVAWALQMRGPLFVSIFSPLMLVATAIAGSLLLQERLHMGSVLGAILIVCGLYTVLWGKGKESKKMLKLVPDGASLPMKDLRDSNRVKTVITSSSEEAPTRDQSNVGLSTSNDEAFARDLCVNIMEEMSDQEAKGHNREQASIMAS